jgi:hypothetical protein
MNEGQKRPHMQPRTKDTRVSKTRHGPSSLEGREREGGSKGSGYGVFYARGQRRERHERQGGTRDWQERGWTHRNTRRQSAFLRREDARPGARLGGKPRKRPPRGLHNEHGVQYVSYMRSTVLSKVPVLYETRTEPAGPPLPIPSPANYGLAQLSDVSWSRSASGTAFDWFGLS